MAPDVATWHPTLQCCPAHGWVKPVVATAMGGSEVEQCPRCRKRLRPYVFTMDRPVEGDDAVTDSTLERAMGAMLTGLESAVDQLKPGDVPEPVRNGLERAMAAGRAVMQEHRR